MLHAVIGIGSNSTRMLIGDVSGGVVTPVRRLREGTRLFAGLENGTLSAHRMMLTADTVARFAKEARDAGCETIRLIATSASRDAKNGAEFRDLVESLCGVPMEIISGGEEARLSFLGCAGGGFSGMVDIGGGSTEIAVGGGGKPLCSVSAQLGAVRLMREIPSLSGDGFDRALALARARAADKWAEANVSQMPAAWVGVGGGLTCLASMDMRLPAYDREAIHGHALGRSAVEAWAKKLAGMEQAQVAQIPGMHPDRADIIAHGTVALLGVMEALDIRRIVVSNRSNLDGCLQELASARAGEENIEAVKAYYDASVEKEWGRLERGYFEFEINKRYIERYVKAGDRVLDVGGGPGRYSLYLAARGADVTLLDLSPGNVAFAREKSGALGVPLKAIPADARFADEVTEGQFDAVLLMGPLYHLLEEADRVQAVEACLKRLKPGGVLFVAFVSMVAGMIYAAREMPESVLWEGEDTFYEKIIADDNFAGAAFTKAFFITPSRVLPFMERFPLTKLHLVGSEGVTAPFKLAGQPPEVRDKWLALSLALCEREDFWNYTEHFLYVGRKEEDTP